MKDGGSFGGSCDSAAHASRVDTASLSPPADAPDAPPVAPQASDCAASSAARSWAFLAQASLSSSSREA